MRRGAKSENQKTTSVEWVQGLAQAKLEKDEESLKQQWDRLKD